VRILALDTATRTGFAIWDGAARRSGFVDFKPGRGESPGMLFVNFERWLEELPAAGGWDLIVYEQAFQMRSGYAAGVALGLIAIVLKFCASRGINHVPVNGARLKKWVTGDGAAKKERVVKKVVETFFASDPPEERLRRLKHLDHNEADAIALIELALAEFVPAGMSG
jgi:Holliday junction resolvasome RuvABC endonuclease subunit